METVTRQYEVELDNGPSRPCQTFTAEASWEVSTRGPERFELTGIASDYFAWVGPEALSAPTRARVEAAVADLVDDDEVRYLMAEADDIARSWDL